MPHSQAIAARAYAAPEGEVEIAIAVIWQERLGAEHVKRHDFFELGRYSLLAMHVVSRLRQGLATEVALREFLARPLLNELASAPAGAARSAGAVDRTRPKQVAAVVAGAAAVVACGPARTCRQHGAPHDTALSARASAMLPPLAI